MSARVRYYEAGSNLCQRRYGMIVTLGAVAAGRLLKTPAVLVIVTISL
jgi:hypothetical protein